MIGERIKMVRKALNLTQEEFAKKIHAKRNTITQYEIGRNEPQSAIITIMCEKYNINRHWLETGEGEMFNLVSKELEITRFVERITLKKESELDQFRLNLISALAKLDESEWETLAKIVDKLANK